MSNDQAKVLINQGKDFYQRREYGSALSKFNAALNLIGSSDTQLRETLCAIIAETKECQKAKQQQDHAESMLRKLRGGF